MILVLSNKWDVTVDFVIKELQKRDYPYLRLNTEEISEIEVTTELPDLSINVEWYDRSVNLVEEVGAVWYRRPGRPYEFNDKQNSPDQGTIDYIEEQWGAWWESLQAIPDITWVNHPVANHKMESKIRQLYLADQLGFTTPETRVTNQTSAPDDLYQEYGSLISKALSSPLIEQENQDEFVYTVHLDEPPNEDDESVQVCPTIFQQPLVPKTDYRVTVVGDKVFPVRIEAEDGESIPVDWRTEKGNVRFVEAELPDRIENLCREYVKEADLLFGAIDLVEHKQEFIFLEINPNGEWGWLQKPWDVPIAETLTELLIQYDKEAE